MRFTCLIEASAPSTDYQFLQFRERYSKLAIPNTISTFEWGKVDSDTAKKEIRRIAKEFQN